MSDDTETLAEVRLTETEREYLRGLVTYFCSHEGRTGRDWCCAACHDLAARIVQARAGEGATGKYAADAWRDVGDLDGVPPTTPRATPAVGESALRERIAAQIEGAIRAHRDAGNREAVAAMAPLPDLIRTDTAGDSPA